MAERMGCKPTQERRSSGREPLVFAIDADLLEQVKALPKRSDLVNRLLRAELRGTCVKEG